MEGTELLSNLLDYCMDEVNNTEGSEDFVNSILVYAEVSKKLENGVKPSLEEMQRALSYTTCAIETIKQQQEEMIRIYMSFD